MSRGDTTKEDARFEIPNYENELMRTLADKGYYIDAGRASLALVMSENNIKQAAEFSIAQFCAFEERDGPCEPPTLVCLFVQCCHFL